MKSFLFISSAIALLEMTQSLPCIGDSCGRLSPLYSEYDDNDGVFYIREGSYNSASSNDDYHEDPEEEDTFGVQSEPLYEQQHGQQQQLRPNRQRPSNNYQQSIGPNRFGQGSYQSNQQQQYDENQETEYIPDPGRNNQGNYNRGNHGGNGGHYQNNRARSNGPYPGSGNQSGGGGHYQYNGAGYNENYPGRGNQGGNGGHYQNNGAGSNGRYPGSGNKGGGGGHCQYNGAAYNGHYPGSGNQGGGGGYNQNNGGSYGRYPSRQSSCPNCYATDFGNGDYNKNIINIEK